MKFTLPTLFASAAFASAHPSGHLVDHHADAKEATLPSVIGHNGVTYSVNKDWAKVTPDQAPVINSHAIAESKNGQLYVVTDHPENAFLVFEKDGTFVRSFGKGLVGGHSLELFERHGKEYLIHVDCSWHFEAEGWKAARNEGKITLLKTDGTIVRTFKSPKEQGQADGDQPFSPTDVTISTNGNILVVDGYASDMVYEYTFDGRIVRRWGGKSKGPGRLSNAHGISLDTTNPDKPLVWISSRDQNQIKAFTPQGKYVETIDLPGAFAGQLFIRNGKMYTAVCWSKEGGTGKRLNESGFILVLDAKTRKVISAPGGSVPVYENGVLKPIHQEHKIFIHGHDLYVDSEEAIYVGEWNANRRYPFKLTPTF